MRILTTFGTRPEAIKMAPVAQRLASLKGVDSRVCVTAQHREMLDQVLEIFSIEPHWDLDIMRAGQDLFDLTGRLLVGMRTVLQDFRPDIVLVHGDTTTTFAVSLACFYSNIRVGHVEAGLRTWNKWSPFPEEMNRHLTTRLADLHFAPTTQSKNNLLKDHAPSENLHLTGNTAIDALLWMAEHLPMRSSVVQPVLDSLSLGDRRMILITAHRRESFGEGFERICLAFRDLSEKYPEVTFVYPVHLNPRVQDPVNRHLSGLDNFRLIPPQPYDAFVALMQRSHLILTDSGGIQEEAPSLGKPVLVLRDTTERPEAVEAGTVLLVGTDRDRIVAETSRLLEDEVHHSRMSHTHNPYGDGHAAERIADAILESFDRPAFFRVHPLA